MKTALIFHASYASPKDHWYDQLAEQLRSDGWEVFVPRFPTPGGQTLDAWIQVIEQYENKINADTLIIGHGVGATLALRVLEAREGAVAGLVLVAPFTQRVEHEGINQATATFVTEDFNWHKIHQNINQISVLIGSGNPFVGEKFSQNVADSLGVAPMLFDGAGHFVGAESGYAQLIAGAVTQLTTPKISTTEKANAQLDQELEKIGIDVNTMRAEELLDDATPKHAAAYTQLDGETTYYEDMLDAVNSADASTMAGILKEEREKEQVKKQKKRRTNTNIIFGLLTVLVLAAAPIVWQQLKPVEVTITPDIDPLSVQIPGTIDTDQQSFIDLYRLQDFEYTDELAARRDAATLPPRDIHELFFAPASVGVTGRIALPRLIGDFGADELPRDLTLALADPYIYGWHGDSQKTPFIIADITSFDRAFAGMESWESDMMRDLRDLMFVDQEFLADESIYTKTFEDEVSGNRRTRALYAPRWEKVSTLEFSEQIIPRPRAIEIIPDSTRQIISAVTTENLIFDEPDEFLENLSVGHVLVYRPGDATPTINRVITGFDIGDEESDYAGKLVVSTRQALIADLVPQLAAGSPDLQTRVLPSGQTEYFVQLTQDKTSLLPGQNELVLLYTFLDEEHLLITTDHAVVDEMLKRLATQEVEG